MLIVKDSFQSIQNMTKKLQKKKGKNHGSGTFLNLRRFI